jgi:hypothetical protein
MSKPSNAQVNMIAEQMGNAVVGGEGWLCTKCGQPITPLQHAYECPECHKKPLHDTCLAEHLREHHLLPPSAFRQIQCNGVFVTPEKAAEICHEDG